MERFNRIKHVEKRGAKKRLPKNTVVVRARIPADLFAKLDVMATRELRSQTSMIQILLTEALHHRSKIRELVDRG